MKIIWFTLLLICSQIAIAQQSLELEAFRKLNTTDQRFDFLADSNVAKMDKPMYEAILPIIEAKKDDKAAFYWHFQYMRFAQHFNVFNNEMFPKIIENMSKAASKKGLEVELIIAQYHIVFNDYGSKRLGEQQVYSAFLQCFEQIKSLGVIKFRRYTLDQILQNIGSNFYALGDNEKALECLLEAENLNKPMEYSSPHICTLILNLIESIYADTKNYPQAITYAEKVYDLNLNNKYSGSQSWYSIFWQGLSSLDIAQYMFEMGNFTEGEKYANRGYELYKTQEDLNNLEKVIANFDALQVLVKIKLQMGKVDEVEPLFKKMEFFKSHIDFSHETNYFKPLRLYNNYYKYYEAKKDYTNAFRYMKLASEMQDSLNRRNDKRKLWQIESRVKAERYQAQIKTAEDDSRLHQRSRNVAILAMFLISGIAFSVYRRIKKDNNTIEQQKALLEQSLGEKETLLREIHHRIKNNLQIISGLFDKQARKTTDETTKKLMKEGQDRVFSIALVHQNLYQTENLSNIELKSYLEMLVKNIENSNASENQNIILELNVDKSILDIDKTIPLGLIINELITNSYKYAFKDRKKGIIKVDFHQKADTFFLKIQDNGIGIPKDLDINKTKSLGLNLVRGLVRQLEGKLDLQSNTEGTTFGIQFSK